MRDAAVLCDVKARIDAAAWRRAGRGEFGFKPASVALANAARGGEERFRVSIPRRSFPIRREFRRGLCLPGQCLGPSGLRRLLNDGFPEIACLVPQPPVVALEREPCQHGADRIVQIRVCRIGCGLR